MKESWKDIRGYEGLYEISSLGRVRSVPHYVIRQNGRKYSVNQRELNPGKDGWGYLFVVLRKEGKNTNKKVHRLVAENFLDNPLYLPCVNHKNENILDNTVENLEWCTAAYNLNYGNRRKKEIETKGTKVLQYTEHGEFIASFPSIGEAARRTRLDKAGISQCLNGRRKKGLYKKYQWKKEER